MSIQTIALEPDALQLIASYLECTEIGLSLLVIGGLVGNKLIRGRRIQSKLKALDVWTQVFESFIRCNEVPADLKLSKKEAVVVLQYWNRLIELATPDLQERLIQLAQQLGFKEAALSCVKKHSMEHRMLGIITLGYLGDQQTYEQLEKLLKKGKAFFTMTVCRSLLLLNPEKASTLVLALAVHQAWPGKKVAELLNLCPASYWVSPVQALLHELNPAEQTRLVMYLSVLEVDVLREPVRELAQSTTEPTILSACLRFIEKQANPDDRTFIMTCFDHEDWVVRLRALLALKPVAQSQDIELIQPMLNDDNWWVRYRAAQLLTSLPSFQLKDFILNQYSISAREVLNLAILEKA